MKGVEQGYCIDGEAAKFIAWGLASAGIRLSTPEPGHRKTKNSKRDFSLAVIYWNIQADNGKINRDVVYNNPIFPERPSPLRQLDIFHKEKRA